MKRPAQVLRGAVSGVSARFSAGATPERELLLGTVLLVSAISGTIGVTLAQYFEIDVLSSVLTLPYDCWVDSGIRVGRHCFSDYSLTVGQALRPNPWEPYPLHLMKGIEAAQNPYPPAAMLPHAIFGLLGKLLHAPLAGLFGYELALAISLLTPAVWATRGVRGLERVVVFVVLSAAAAPVWAVLDRGNSVGFVVPIALVFLVALCRRRWGLVTLMVVLASLVKPQFLVLGFVLPAARQWRWSGIAVLAGVLSNLGAYLLWPRNFPSTIGQSVRSSLSAGGTYEQLAGGFNVSIQKGLLTIPDAVAAAGNGGKVPDGFLEGPRVLLGYVVLLLVLGCVLVLGHRIPPVQAGIVLLATASLFPPVTFRYYLAFVLPIAALIVRDPDGRPGYGIFQRFADLGDRRRIVGISISLATALTIAQIPVPGHASREPIMGLSGSGLSAPLVLTTVGLVPVFWLLACAVIIGSYARRPAGAAEDFTLC
ncbi:MAG: DUF2029 domain-containing protein [Mycobacterium sp.]|uniref:glycosyltransferase family 87 protein n=1 Tax=Mycobacterium sp. TaxID=1785 RepID=UPI001EC1B822|nr:glycosyltransferase family 87 protein [Mycobacterium sp.]MBW0019055.1 DUF2029 domain-containing protein [Mycobacterium sp.]